MSVERVASLPIALFLTISLPSCTTSGIESEPGFSANGAGAPSESTLARPPTNVDLSRMAELRADFPPDFLVAPPSQPESMTQDAADLVGNTVSYRRRFSVEPRQCKPLFEPVVAHAGAVMMGIGAEGPEQQVITVSADSPISVPEAIPASGCEHMKFDVDDDAVITEGVAERLAAPVIEGAATTAMKVTTTFSKTVDFFYVAILDGRTYVEVRGRVKPDFPAEPALPDLLSKAVAVIRQT